MANEMVTGTVVDERGNPLEGLTVIAFDVDVLINDDFLGSTVTDLQGRFSISYSPGSYGYGLEPNPDIVVRVYDPVKRLLAETEVRRNITDTILALPNIQISQADAKGWLVTNGTGAPTFLSGGNAVEYLIDNEAAWGAITLAVKKATTSIDVLHLYLDVPASEEGFPLVFTLFDSSYETNPAAAGTTLEEELIDADLRNVAVQLCFNDFFLFGQRDSSRLARWPHFSDSADRVLSYFTSQAAVNVDVRLFQMHQMTPMHAKVVIVDRKQAFVVGSPIMAEYYDGQVHKICDSRRGTFVTANMLRVPIHDVSMAVRGPAVADLHGMFRLHWNEARPTGTLEQPPIAPPAAEAANVSLQVVRTLHGESRFASISMGETGILEAYLRAIREAKRFIYIENQYFTCDDIADALVLAIKQKPDLRVIMLLNNLVDIPLYGPLPLPIVSRLSDGWQTNLIERMLGELSESERQRIGFFTLWSHEPAKPPEHPKSRIIRTYVHTKACIVDDEWATIGTANLDGVSLKTSEHLVLADGLLLGAPDFSQRRASEINVVILDGIAGQPATGTVKEFRRKLWSEHLGYRDAAGNLDPNARDLLNPPDGGWLKLWQDKAEAKRKALNEDPPRVEASRLLALPIKDDNVALWVDKPDGYLRALGIDTSRLTVETEAPSYSFEQNKWE
jgi:phosphatidylserine/phosphatidylglycerophosphate/cardiolipin synthase-like enzyme